MEKPKRRLKIIFGDDKSEIADHAKMLLRAIKRDESLNPRAARPMGIASHIGLHPCACDECGEMFWARDPWASHKGCKGARTGAGF